MPFRALGLGPNVLKAIQEAGYAEPTPIQTKAIPVIRKRKDVIATAQTGTGKTAAYTWPVIEHLAAQHLADRSKTRRTRVLVLVPTRELAVQVDESVRTYSKHMAIQVAAVYGGVNETPQIRALRNRVDVVVATPGRLLDLMSSMPHRFDDLDTLILDEADRMLDMGFLPDIRRIIRSLPKERQTLLFSATFSAEIEKVSREFLHNPETVEVGRRAAPTHTVAQFVYEIPPPKKVALLLHLLKDEGLDTVLVFSRTKRGADKLARRLEQEGISVATLHSNKSQSQRQAALKGFKSGRYRVLVATDIAARGIDVDGISHVVNYDFPAAPEDYVHRIGRTGRAAAVGDALSFVSHEDLAGLRALERFIGRGIPRRTVEGLPEVAPLRPLPPEPRSRQSGSGGRPQRSSGSSSSRGQGSSKPSYGGGSVQGRPVSSGRSGGQGGSGSHGGPGSRPARPHSESAPRGQSSARPHSSASQPQSRSQGGPRSQSADGGQGESRWGRRGQPAVRGKGPRR